MSCCRPVQRLAPRCPSLGRGDDTVGNPDGAQFSQFYIFELILLLKFDKRLNVEQFEATAPQSTLPSPPRIHAARGSQQSPQRSAAPRAPPRHMGP